MRAGELDRRITLQTRSTSKSGTTGSTSEQFTTLATVWAQVKDLRGREFAAARQVNAEITTVFRIRWRTGVNELGRILYNGRTYDVVAPPAEIGRREGLEIMATAKTS
jgi:SPP1 family predicted phage head-tail adaptor